MRRSRQFRAAQPALGRVYLLTKAAGPASGRPAPTFAGKTTPLQNEWSLRFGLNPPLVFNDK